MEELTTNDKTNPTVIAPTDRREWLIFFALIVLLLLVTIALVLSFILL